MVAWVNYSESTPTSIEDFLTIMNALVFNCPSSIRSIAPKKDAKTGVTTRIPIYHGVSARQCSFRARGVNKNLLTTILAQIRRPLAKNLAYVVLEAKDDVTTTVDDIIRKTRLADPFFDVIVYQKRSDMSDTEAIYYYIRNAFAHGSFGIVQHKSEDIYVLESKKDNTVKAQMRLKQSTLIRYIELSRMGGNQIRSMQKKKKEAHH